LYLREGAEKFQKGGGKGKGKHFHSAFKRVGREEQAAAEMRLVSVIVEEGNQEHRETLQHRNRGKTQLSDCGKKTCPLICCYKILSAGSSMGKIKGGQRILELGGMIVLIINRGDLFHARGNGWGLGDRRLGTVTLA